MRGMAAAAGLKDQIEVDSAGTHDYHAGCAPEPRAVRVAAQRGYELVELRARRFTADDFRTFDLICAMDRGHLAILERRRPNSAAAQVRLFMDFAPSHSPHHGANVPDPYYGDAADFEIALDMIEEGARGLVEAVRRRGP